LDITPATYVIELTGPSEKLDAFIATVDADNIIEVVRSGATGISRGEKGLHL
jgi:acetolactate synthase-1/3 small subunit